jgi:hypothetical protein
MSEGRDQSLRGFTYCHCPLFWKAAGMIFQGELFVLTGKAADAVETITSGIAALLRTGATRDCRRPYQFWLRPMANWAYQMHGAALAKLLR